MLTEFEEQLVKWLGVLSNLGNPKTKDDLVKGASDVQKLCKSSDTPQFKNELSTEY